MLTTAVASATGPFWHTEGKKLEQGSKGLKLQSKGPLSLKSTLAGIEVVITCGHSTSEATIDGQGPTKQGQGKGIVKYEQCETKGGTAGVCKKPIAITTNQLKTHLATAVVQGKTQIVELLEPSPSQQVEKPTFVKIPPFAECSGTAAPLLGISPPVNGKVAGLVEPQGREVQEGQEGSLYFPPEPIKKINHEQQEVEVILTLGATETEATFTGWYGARAQSGTFGAFNQ
jgi:hypothetical protein